MQIEIVSVQAFPATDPKRIGQFDSMIVYRIDKRRVDSLTIAVANPDKAAIEKAIVEQQKTRASLIGHSFEIK